MCSSTFISLYLNGRQYDYDAIFFYNDDTSCLFQVTINEKKLMFEGGIDHSFSLSNQQENLKEAAEIDNTILDAFGKQMDRMFL